MARVDELPVVIIEQLNPEADQPDEALATLNEIAALVVARLANAHEGAPVDIITPGKFVDDIA